MKIRPHPHDGYYNTDEQLLWKIGSLSDPAARIPKGERAHVLRESMDYAFGLLSTDDKYRTQRALSILNRVLNLQDTDKSSSTFGLWPKYLEEPLTSATDPDGFWADIIGFRMCKVIAMQSERLSTELSNAVLKSIGNAAYAVLNRNRSLPDSRFALISVVVTLTGAEITGDDRLLSFGTEHLREIVSRTQRAGEFGEYNSPNLTLLALEECDLLIDLIRDQRALSYAKLLNHIAWRTITEHFHPPTRQWAGPHGWTDHDTLTDEQVAAILDPESSCPEEFRSRLLFLPDAEVTVRHSYIQRTNKSGNASATTFMTGKVCIGSADEEILWQHRRPLIAYWPSSSGNTAVLRVRFLHDGHDFASGLMQSAQDRGRILSSFGVKRKAGDLHAYFDRPVDGVFRASDFRIRYQLTADDAKVEDIGYGIFEMTSGDHVAVIHSLPGYFDNSLVRWTFGREAKSVYVDAVCYAGKETEFKPGSSTEILVPAALELLEKGEAISLPPELTKLSDHDYALTWPEMKLEFKARPRR